MKFESKGTSRFPDKFILKISYCEITIQGNKNIVSTELAHRKTDKHFCVALHRKVRIRLHPSTGTVCGIHKREQLKDGKMMHDYTINYSDWFHSNEYRQNALADNVSAQLIMDKKRNLFLHINHAYRGMV